MEYKIISSRELAKAWTGQDWERGHAAALISPSSGEEPLVQLLQIAGEMASRFGQDYVLRDGVAHLLLGAQELLNAEWGRLDRGSLDRLIGSLAESIGYDLATEEFKD